MRRKSVIQKSVEVRRKFFCCNMIVSLRITVYKDGVLLVCICTVIDV